VQTIEIGLLLALGFTVVENRGGSMQEFAFSRPQSAWHAHHASAPTPPRSPRPILLPAPRAL
jgi:hypothetical protein